MKDWKSFLKGDLLGVHLAVNIFVGTTLLWLLLRLGANTSPIWAISAMVASIDPQVKLAVVNLRGRILNALLGCATGFLCHLANFKNLAAAGTKKGTRGDQAKLSLIRSSG
jgi:hypothetical protein